MSICMTVIVSTNRLLRRKKIERETEEKRLRRIVSSLSKIDPKMRELSFQTSNKTYIKNKKDVFVCMKKKNGRFYSKNIISFAIIHELAHALTPTVKGDEHPPEFVENFNKLLNIAREQGLYKPIDKIEEYCGHIV